MALGRRRHSRARRHVARERERVGRAEETRRNRGAQRLRRRGLRRTLPAAGQTAPLRRDRLRAARRQARARPGPARHDVRARNRRRHARQRDAHGHLRPLRRPNLYKRLLRDAAHDAHSVRSRYYAAITSRIEKLSFFPMRIAARESAADLVTMTRRHARALSRRSSPFNFTGASYVPDRHCVSQRLRPHEETRRCRARGRAGRGRARHADRRRRHRRCGLGGA
ncbi:hypothetical protein PSP6_680062 [Paraburkholderia tropica]|nr:hypothetical protein PSP6_680062 [Paraburkholderia tropica]